MRKVRIRLELLERCIPDNAAFPERLIGFERVVRMPRRLAKALATMILVVALGDRSAPLAVDFLDRTGRVEWSRGVADQISIEART